MYKILVVEDEKIERDSLIDLMNELKPEISEVFYAENGEQGLEKYISCKPDLILTDINMPKIDGLRMIEKIRQIDKNVVCLILTSYDYFSYAQKAIQLGVVDFILKPVDNETLKQSILLALNKIKQIDQNKDSNLIKKIDQVKKVIENDCFYSMMIKRDEKSVLESLNMLGIRFCSGFCIVLNHKKENKEKLQNIKLHFEEQKLHCILGSLQKEDIIFVISEDEITKQYQKSLRFLMTKSEFSLNDFDFGQIKHKIVDLYKSYQEGLYQLNLESNISQYEENRIQELIEDWSQQALESFEDAPLNIKEFAIELSTYENNKIEKSIQLFLEKLANKIELQYGIESINFESHLNKYAYYNNVIIEQILLKYIEKFRKNVLDHKYKNGSHLLKKGITYIENNYKKPISLNDLAEELNVSTFYISKIFSREGYNFTEIVNDMRIKEAKRLIIEGYSFKEVAYKVGFGSQSYFTKIFKKKVGLSPKEYRNMN